MALSRRDLIVGTAVGAGLVVIGERSTLFSSSPSSPSSTSTTVPRAPGTSQTSLDPEPVGLGPLVPDPDGILDLPEGFRYSIVSRAGDPLTGGGVMPGRPDGMAAFGGEGDQVRVVQNHEIGNGHPQPTLASPELTYDPKAQGGTTTHVLDARLAAVSTVVSLAGTWTNCAGGVTPWGTWLTCEETEQQAGPDADLDHGFVFEVDPVTSSNNPIPTPLTALGRFAHEAVCVDPDSGTLYLTEDAGGPNGLVYRFEPTDRTPAYGALRNGGTLTAMRCSSEGQPAPDLSVFTVVGTTLQVTWTAIPDPQAATVSVRNQLGDNEVTRSRKFEGAWWGDHPDGGRAHIVCSFARVEDGSLAAHDGQVWAYDPQRKTLTLEVRFAPNPYPDSDNPDGPDNITVSPHGGLMLAEDGQGLQHLFAIDDQGAAQAFARNRVSSSELTGVCFSPDGQTLFVSIQDDGLTFAVQGPFARR